MFSRLTPKMKMVISLLLLGSLSLATAAPQFNPFTFFNRPSRPSRPTFSRPSQPAPSFSSPSSFFRRPSSSSSSSGSGREEEYNGKYFWTGGTVSGRSISWPSGSHNNNIEWSHTGGARPPRPQPDNREGNEFCIGVLNNFYNDGVKFHDISCHHKKPIICEEQ